MYGQSIPNRSVRLHSTRQKVFYRRTGPGQAGVTLWGHMDSKLKKMTRNELEELRGKIDVALKEREKEELKAARDALVATAEQHGFSLDELLGKSTEKTVVKRAPAKPKYRNPDDASVTWSGRGRKPHWVVAAEDAGKSLDDLEI
jgi:DNA-binding protein H-NS